MINSYQDYHTDLPSFPSCKDAKSTSSARRTGIKVSNIVLLALSGALYVRSSLHQDLFMSGALYIRSSLCQELFASGALYFRSYLHQELFT